MIYVALAARWLLALLFLTSGVSKLSETVGFAETVSRYEILPARHVPAVSRAIPVLEVALGLVLAAGVLPAVAGLVASAALLAFAAAVILNLLRGRRFDCGCGGVMQREIGWPLVVRILGIAAVAVGVALWPAGLALWTAGLVHGHGSTSARDLVAVPLGVIILVAGVRSAVAYRAATRIIDTALPGGIAD